MRTASKVERPLLQDLGQRLAVDVLHREIGRAEIGIDREHVVADDRLVVEVVQRRRFLAEQRERGLVLRHLRADRLDRDRIAGLDGAALVDLAHAADRDQTLDLVDAVEPRAGADARPDLRRVVP